MRLLTLAKRNTLKNTGEIAQMDDERARIEASEVIRALCSGSRFGRARVSGLPATRDLHRKVQRFLSACGITDVTLSRSRLPSLGQQFISGAAGRLERGLEIAVTTSCMCHRASSGLHSIAAQEFDLPTLPAKGSKRLMIPECSLLNSGPSGAAHNDRIRCWTTTHRVKACKTPLNAG